MEPPRQQPQNPRTQQMQEPKAVEANSSLDDDSEEDDIPPMALATVKTIARNSYED